MFETLLASHLSPLSWRRPALLALLIHGAVVVAATAGTDGDRARHLERDTIRLELMLPRRLPPRHSIPNPTAPPAVPDLSAPSAIPPIRLERLRLDLRLDPRALVSPSNLTGRRSGVFSQNLGRTAPGSDSVFAAGDVDQPPELAEEVHPRYPDALRGRGLSGVVELEYVISSDGRVDRTTMQVHSSPHPAFSRAAVDGLADARFRPALRNGHPVPVRVRQSIRFLTR